MVSRVNHAVIDNFVHQSKPYIEPTFFCILQAPEEIKKVQLRRLKQVQQRSRCTIKWSLFKAYIESACFRKKFGTWTRNILDPRALLQSSSLFILRMKGLSRE